jgi:glycosyltransferase involved in cell wall biosynthesis
MSVNRVCMISQSGHTDPRVRRQAESLAENGYEVDIICAALNKDDEKIVKFGSITFYRVLLKKRFEGIILNSLHYFHFFVIAFLNLQYLSLKRNYELIQIHNMPEFHVFTAVFQKMAGIPIVLDLHDLTPELFECKWEDKSKLSLIFIIRFVEKISCMFADRLITVTDVCKENLVKRGMPSDKITLVLNTPNQNIFKYDSEREYKVITDGARLIYHGTVAERFGLHIAIEAMKYIKEKIPNSVFSIYGHYDRSYKIYLEKLIKQFNLEENVTLHGEYSQEVIYGFVKESDFGVVPYINNEYMNLCLSTKMFEYNASLLPVIASRLKSPSMIFGDDSIAYAEPDNAHDFAEKLVMLCSNPSKRKSMATKAYSVLQSISGQIMSDRYLNLIGSTINGKKVIKVNAS